MSAVRLIAITPKSERLIAYCARVSNPENQENPNIAGLLRYCIQHGHWSIFEMANMVLEITTTRAIAAQILRHRSFSFQEFSQRYATVPGWEAVHPRKQHEKARQSSTDDLDVETITWFTDLQTHDAEQAFAAYHEATRRGIAHESARFLLPLSAQTRLYMSGTIRSWIHYCQLRTTLETQAEHRSIAEDTKQLLILELPIIAEALGWT